MSECEELKREAGLETKKRTVGKVRLKSRSIVPPGRDMSEKFLGSDAQAKCSSYVFPLERVSILFCALLLCE